MSGCVDSQIIHGSWIFQSKLQKGNLGYSLYTRKDRGWQQRAIKHAYAAFSNLQPVLSEQRVPAKAISVIDDTDVSWHNEPIKLLVDISEVVRLSEPGSLPSAINSKNGKATSEI